MKTTQTWYIRDNKLDLGSKTLVMGIVNVTPDSFSDGGAYNTTDAAVAHALQLVKEGANILDIGGESTRPGSKPVSEQQELDRVLPVISQIAQSTDIPISIDTYKAAVAEQALDAGAHIVNDISGLRFDSNMAPVVARYQAGLVLMHIKGTPRDMQLNPEYQALIPEIFDYLESSIQLAESHQIPRNRIVVDPGIGFGKTIEDNFKLIHRLGTFKRTGCPVLAGPSRKSFIGKTLDLPVEDRLEGTLAAVTAAVVFGANIVRVHDVKACLRAVKIADKIIDKRAP